ncbi:MAG: S8 family serine peptidase [Cyclonatronaceae bacterium]
MIVQKTEITSRVRFYAFGVLILLLTMAGCDSITSPDATTDFQSRNLQNNGQTNSAGHLNPDFSDQADRPHLIEGHYIVVLSGEPGKKNPRAAATLEALSKDVGNMQGARLKRVYKSSFTGFAAELSDEQVEGLRRDPRVLFVEQDSYVYPSSGGIVQKYPTWGLDRIDQREPLLDRAYAYTATGAGVNAYIIDSGIRYTHEEFGGRATLGYDFVLEENPDNTDLSQGPGDDCMGHGTLVAGTVGGRTYGVAKGTNLISVRVFGCTGTSPWSRVLAAVDWVTANAELPAVANMSLGGPVHPEWNLMRFAIQNANAAGINHVVAANNSNEDACNSEPARTPEAITVGASNIGDARASFSNYGDCVDLYAPGVHVMSAWINDDWSGDGTNRRQASGTSMAAPHVAGVVALYLEANPTASPADVHSTILANTTPDAVTDVPSGTDRLLYSLWSPVEIIQPPQPEFNLVATGTKENGNQVIYLTWDVTSSPMVEVFRNGWAFPNLFNNNGWFRDNTGVKGNHGTYVHQICESSQFYLPACSNEVTTVYGDGGDGGGGEEPNSPPSADFTYQANKLTVQFTDTSTDSDGTITGWLWDFGAGNSSNVQHPLHTFSVAGTYAVSLTVTDNDGGTGSTSKNIYVSDDVIAPGDIVLTANGYKVRGRIIIDLSWSGAKSATVDIYRDGTLIAPGITDSGEYIDHTGQNGGGIFTHNVCEAGTQICSNVTTTSL